MSFISFSLFHFPLKIRTITFNKGNLKKDFKVKNISLNYLNETKIYILLTI
jgi:hypothetical protein